MIGGTGRVGGTRRRAEVPSGLASLFVPEYPPAPSPPVPLDAVGERRLQGAVFEDAVLVLRTYSTTRDPKTRRLYDETVAWFACDDDSGPFAFVTICACLGYHPDWIRRSIAKLPARKLRVVRPEATGARPWTPHRLFALRHRLALTQAGLAARLGVAQSTVRAWELGQMGMRGSLWAALERLEGEAGT